MIGEFQCEINKTCLSILDKHWPGTKRTNDVAKRTTRTELVRLRPDLIGFGSPCQDLSVAGRRGGLVGKRSGLFYKCVDLCLEAHAKWVLWENVPGVFSSHEGRDFASVLEAFTGTAFGVPADGWRNSGVAIGPLYSVAWCVLDSQYFGVPQRRRRVFLVGHLGNRGHPFQVLALGDGMQWNSPPQRGQGASVAHAVGCSAGGSKHGSGRQGQDDFVISGTLGAPSDGQGPRTDADRAGAFIPTDYGLGTYKESDISSPLTKGGDYTRQSPIVAGNLCNNRKASGSATNQDAEAGMLVPVSLAENQRGELLTSDIMPQLSSGGGKPGQGYPAIAYQCHGSNVGPMGTLRQGNGNEAGGVPFIPVAFQTRVGRNGRGQPKETVDALTSCEGGTHADSKPHVASAAGVRRLTPRECERLQGFPDDWTRWDATGKEIADSPRYQAIGNAVTVPVIEWIAKRIVYFENLK